MATEIITRTLCDKHLSVTDDGDTPEGTAYTITINGQTRVVDLCEECGGPVRELREMLAEFGRPEGSGERVRRKATETEANEPCPLCHKAYANLAKLRAHVRQAHDTSLPSARGEVTNFVCPHDGQYFEGNQGLAVHITRSHSGRWTVEPESEKSARGGKAGKAA
jgi:hypothetical protein